ncbi:ARM repeat-containing protein [Xylona heveae TC161]|uniref:non-specific serine/threonine protein kinase n=1 Tax=Xylona heveae (strain CBS 132557 / TC161) TaxID=1328760 RepID=A0A164ZQP3_XYLHT|nr:ARM repeat-containing protein [Xylona heveae TC161]KZF19387.1 ARM repeat-containing protein [Xylona heveae TC161]
MGQGFSLTTLSAGSANIDVPELYDLAYEKSLGTARFMKSIRARHHDGLVFVKVVVKPYSSMKLDQYVKELLRERKALADIPNALGYERILETSANGYLARQYIHSSLYDRMSTRPFLENIEKRWLAFQLLCAVRDCHAREIYHGDIKTENILVTSWNWLFLSDFSSSFKPTYLPEDNPADFSYYFDTSGRRTCYLAPERFYSPATQNEERGPVNWAMDIFSVGCVIAELFLEAPIFSLSQLYKYRKGEYDPEHAHLRKIEDRDIRELVSHMIQIEPESRFPAEEYLNFWRRKAFPEYFYSFLHQYMGLITDPSSGRAPITTGITNLGEADDRIDRVFYDFDKISYFLGYDTPNKHSPNTSSSVLGFNLIPVHLDIPNNRHQASATSFRPAEDGTLIFLTLIVSSLRNTARSTAKIRACDILLAFAERIPDEAKIDRVLPYVMALLNDPADIVQIAALRTVTQLMAMVSVVSPINAYVFPEYVLPRFQPFYPGATPKMKPTVRATYAACLATLANTSSRFLDLVQALRADGSLPTADPEAEDSVATNAAYQNLFDVARTDLVDYFESHTKALLTDNDPSVRRAFLGSVSSLCIFFGSLKASDVILSHLNTYLNDRDWMLKCTFFKTIVGVATIVGSFSLEEFVLPLMVQALTDPEEFVVENVLRSLASMAELGLFQRSKTWEIIGIVCRFMMHPNAWIREAAAHFISSATSFLPVADKHCIIGPLLQPYFKTPVTDFNELLLLGVLKKPLSRGVLDLAASWATKVEKGEFWKDGQAQRIFAFGAVEDPFFGSFSKHTGNNALNKVSKNEEDEQWLTRLRNIGMAPEDEWKLLALREYIWRMAPRKPKEGAGNAASHLNNVITLKQLEITPQTVFFNEKQYPLTQAELRTQRTQSQGEGAPHTIADALLDASSTIDNPGNRRKRPLTSNGRESLEFAPLLGPGDVESAAIDSPTLPSPSSLPPSRPGEQQDILPLEPDGDSRVKSLRPSQVAVEAQEESIDNGEVADGRPTKHNHHMRHQSSAMNLMNRADLSKAYAETSTTSTNVFGKVNSAMPREPSVHKSENTPKDQKSSESDYSIRFRAAHTYDGNDPSVLKLLDSLYVENYPADVVEFGPMVTPISRRQPIKRSSGNTAERPWRPEGTLVATFGEHTGPINRVLVAADHAFFITGSDDGTVKVWDTARLERNLAHRARLTHKHAPGAKVKCLAFVENTHSFISGASDGSIHVVKVDYSAGATASRYGKLRLLREYTLPKGEFALWMEHFKAETHSVLLVATNKSRILALELRTMKVLYSLENPVHDGIPTCFCLDRKHTWLLLGTSHGVLILWDLRFQIKLKAWGLAGGTAIHRLCVHPLKGRGKWVCVAGGTGQEEITVWDIEKAQCREVYRTGGSKEGWKGYEPWKIEDERPEGMLGRFATALEPSGNAGIDRGVRSLVVGLDTSDDGRDSRCGFLITGGFDRKVRYWDMTHVEGSLIVSGLDIDELKPTFTSSHPTASLTVNAERFPQPAPTAPNAGVGNKTSSNTAKKVTGRLPRSTVISLQQQNLLKSHLDIILDVALLESPYGMIISVDRSGVIYVFQ